MRKYLFLITLLSLASVSFAQFTPSKKAMDMMSSGDKSTVKNCDKYFSDASRKIKKAEQIEKKYQKYNTSKKRKKYEKKTKEAKMLRIQAQETKAKAYKKLVKIYVSVVQNGKFYYDQDQQLANDFVQSAEEEKSGADNSIKKYNGLKSSKFKKERYSAINTAIERNEEAYQNALRGLEDAIGILSEQEGKNSKEKSDKNAWMLAEQENTAAAFKTYLSTYPTGVYADDARERIANLEEEEAALAKRKVENAITYKVQILADKNAWTKEKIADIYPSVPLDQIYEWFDDSDSYFKYATGEFKRYGAAKSLRNELKNERQDVFIIAFKKGFQIDIVEARTATNEIDDE